MLSTLLPVALPHLLLSCDSVIGGLPVSRVRRTFGLRSMNVRYITICSVAAEGHHISWVDSTNEYHYCNKPLWADRMVLWHMGPDRMKQLYDMTHKDVTC